MPAAAPSEMAVVLAMPPSPQSTVFCPLRLFSAMFSFFLSFLPSSLPAFLPCSHSSRPPPPMCHAPHARPPSSWTDTRGRWAHMQPTATPTTPNYARASELEWPVASVGRSVGRSVCRPVGRRKQSGRPRRCVQHMDGRLHSPSLNAQVFTRPWSWLGSRQRREKIDQWGKGARLEVCNLGRNRNGAPSFP